MPAERPAQSAGRRISASVQRFQKSPRGPAPPSVAGGRRATLRARAPVALTTRPRRSRRSPSTAIRAGSSVTAPRTAIATTTIAPIAIERITVESSRKSPASEMTTVVPEKTTVAPDVRIATSSAASRPAPRASSSRYRDSRNSE